MNPHRILTLPLAIVSAIALSSLTAYSANITWGSAQQITGTTDVSTAGTLVGAFNIGAPGVSSTTVNGVTFQSFPTTGGSGSSGNFTLSTGDSFATNTATSSNAPFSGLPAEYKTLLSSFVATSFDGGSLIISGLIVGMQYQFQAWVNQSTETFGQRTDFEAGNTVSLVANSTGGDGGLGRFVIGTFTADSTMQTILISGDGEVGGVFNAFQLRNVTQQPTGVPETGSTLALLAGALGLMGFARRKLRV